MSACAWCSAPSTYDDPVRRLPLHPRTPLCPTCTRVHYAEKD